MVVPKELLLQKLYSVQSEDDGFMFQHAVYIQTNGWDKVNRF